MTKSLYILRPMDEQLIVCQGELWDPDESASVRAKIRRVSSKRRVDKEAFMQDVEGAYHAIGGMARLAHLANEDPKWFFNRFGDRLLPNVKEEVDVNITINPPLPPSPLDEPLIIDVTPREAAATLPAIAVDQIEEFE